VEWLGLHQNELVGWRRELHSHPEVGYAEHRTTDLIVTVLSSFGLAPKRLSFGTGVICDLGPGPDFVALRADIDALPLPDHKTVSYASQNAGVCHACGHDVHTAILLAVAGCLARDGVGEIFALHCDPKLDVGQIGLRVGPITASCNQLDIKLTGPGGHTARPQLTVDLVYALGKLITELPGLLSRRIDPRAAVSLVWGAVAAGSAANAIPTIGTLRGTVRMLDDRLWNSLESVITELARQIVAPTGVQIEINYDAGVPAVTNDGSLVGIQTRAVLAAFGAEAVSDTPQSMGGEDFAWYLQAVPGALARLGVRGPGAPLYDLHQSNFDIDEDALAIGVRFTAALLDEFWSGTTKTA
jgi:metal-dependent amidase/aminoacylase/carboxypeptidase family protein